MIIISSGLLTALVVGFLLSVFFHSAAQGPALERWEVEQEQERREAAKQPPKAAPRAWQVWLSEHSTDIGIIGIALAIIVVAGILI
ncbi:hypothetical protein FMZ73_07435 [Salmonella enterica subsp. enterica]|nr:hypothetical protein [Salmonella enterica subsp. enterica serovar Nigeria]EDG1633161.1 hypothetical protein [Salmonella enterica subsp. enterica serovar Nigeria]EGM6703115.1 hypothetical protein [Salmonella enterica subsp. enterica serovar Nigeria]